MVTPHMHPFCATLMHLMCNPYVPYITPLCALCTPYMPFMYRSGMLNSNTVNLKFHLIRSFFEIFARFLSFHVKNAQLIRTQLI